MPIVSFRNEATEEIARGRKSKQTLRLLPADLHPIAYKRLIYLDNVRTLMSLRAWPGLRLEKLSGDREGEMSIRINIQYRICFRFESGNSSDVEIVDYHR